MRDSTLGWGWRRAWCLLAAALVAAGSLWSPAASAQEEFAPSIVEPSVREVEPFSSAGSVQVGSFVPWAGMPGFLLLGHDYDYSVTGPLSVDVGGYLGLSQSLLVLRAVPGLKYKFVIPELPFIPYAKAGLSADLLYGDGARDQSVALGLRVAGGLRFFFHSQLAFGAELGATFGLAAGDETHGAAGVEGLVSFEYLVP